MLLPLMLILTVQLLALRVWAVYTGFNYGSSWIPGDDSTCKYKADFVKSFNLAKRLPTPVRFDSARLFTTRHCSTSEPIEALDAAVETNTTLLLGFWLSPPKIQGVKPNATANAEMLGSELKALEKAFEKHGDRLASLIIGLSVGNEDIFAFHDNANALGVPAEIVTNNLKAVRDAVKNNPVISAYMKGKPIGHTETPQNAADLEGLDFIGLNSHPYWHPDPVGKANQSCFETLAGVRKRSGEKPDIWLTEVGWPLDDHVTKFANRSQANQKNMQQYWTDLGCSLIGKYNTFWFELDKDSDDKTQPDWAIIDPQTQQLRINLTCPGFANLGSQSSPIPSETASTLSVSFVSGRPSSSPSFPAPSEAASKALVSIISSPASPNAPGFSWPGPSRARSSSSASTSPSQTSSTLPGSSFSAPSETASSLSTPFDSGAPSPPILSTVGGATITITATVTASSAETTDISVEGATIRTECVTVADVSSNGEFVSVDVNTAGSNGECSTPFPFTGLPYTAPSTTDLAAADPATTDPTPAEPSASSDDPTEAPSFSSDLEISSAVAATSSPNACVTPSAAHRRAPIRTRHFVPIVSTNVPPSASGF